MRQYSVYKNSGIEWVGEIPERWSAKPLFSLFKERQAPNEGNREANVLSLSYGRIIRRNVESNFGLLPESFETYNIVEPLDIVLRLTDLQNDKRSLRCGLVKEKGIITSAYLTLQKIKDVDCKYMFYLLHNYDIRKVFYSMGGGVRQAIKFDDLKRLSILLPSLDEQKAIMGYLDRKTSQIDDLITKKKRMIDLLKEERTAIIKQAVTKGLNSNVGMKNSSIEWLGDVPGHWGIKKLKYLFRIINGATPSSAESDFWDGSIPWATPDDFSSTQANGVLTETRRKITNQGYQSCGTSLAPSGSVILSTRAPIGYLALIGQDMCCNQGCRILVKNCAEAKERYFYYYLLANTDNLASLGQGSTFKELSRDKLATFFVLNPPPKEQEEIIAFLDYKIEQVDTLIVRALKTVELLKEFRITLISEVVTGKIDVQECVS